MASQEAGAMGAGPVRLFPMVPVWHPVPSKGVITHDTEGGPIDHQALPFMRSTRTFRGGQRMTAKITADPPKSMPCRAVIPPGPLQKRVLAFLFNHPDRAWAPREIKYQMDEAGKAYGAPPLNPNSITKAITRLKREGFIATTGRGRYRAVPARAE